MLIHQFLESSSDAYPDKTAVIHGSALHTYIEIEKKANSMAHWLLESGIKKGDRIGLLLKNSIDYIIAYYGLLKAGAVAVPLNTGIGSEELIPMVKSCTPKVLITEKFFKPIVDEIIQALSFDLVLLYSDMPEEPYMSIASIYSSYPDTRPQVDVINLDLASIIYTSGSTGKPKGVVLSHLNIATNTRSITSYLHLTQRDRCMVVLPFYYVYGKSLLNTHFSVSASIVIDNRFLFPNAVLQAMVKHEATGFSGVPSTFSILLNRSSIAQMNFPHLRYLTQAGGHMPEAHKRQLMEIFPDKDIYIMYGATEASARLAYLEPSELNNRIRSFGKAIPNVELKIIMENGEFAEPGKEGEVVARGANIMSGYWNDPESTRDVLINGWYHTGDLARQDDMGFFYITGRKRDMIKVGKFKVSANEVEEVLFQHPDVEEAAVIGAPDSLLGEAIIAFVVLNQDSNTPEADLLAFCSQHLPRHKVPESIRKIDKLPKNESGKILKQPLFNLL